VRARTAAILGVAVLGSSLYALHRTGRLGQASSPVAPAPFRALAPVATPSALAATWGEPIGPTAEWFDFAPPTDDFSEAALDLRDMNELRAGDSGAIAVAGRTFVRNGKPERFWGVNARDRALKLTDEQMTVFARALAKRGVNLVRLHFRFWQEDDVRRVDAKRLERTHRLVAELAKAGISSALSILLPNALKPRPEDGIPGYDGSTKGYGLLFSDAGFRDVYRGWWRQILSPQNPYTGRSLAEDPALALVELVNEDSTLFWTFQTNGRLPAAQARNVERTFGTFLAGRYGSVQAALDRFGGGPVRGDAPAEGRAGVVGFRAITTTTTARTRETAEFLARHMRDVYAELRSYLTGTLGLRALVVCSNWVTASGRLLGPLDKWANGACDVMDQHGYFSGPHTGKDAHYLILSGHRYDDRSGLRADPRDDPEKTHDLPTSAVAWQDKPGIVSELGWPSPNRFRAELPLLALAYGSLHGTSAFAFFTTESPGYAPMLWKFGIADPAVLGQFPGAALAFRRGYVAEGAVVASARPNLDDLFRLRGGPLGETTVLDALRRPDIPDDARDGTTPTVPPFAALVGRVEVGVRRRARGVARRRAARELQADPARSRDRAREHRIHRAGHRCSDHHEPGAGPDPHAACRCPRHAAPLGFRDAARGGARRQRAHSP
jgi:hypothetical protein